MTIGNILGGAVMVGAVYWFVYLRRPAKDTAVSTDGVPVD
jgi:formate/nitrite transporter FocA (FNT family)